MSRAGQTKKAVLELSAKPGSGKSNLTRREDGSIQAHLKSLPVDGKANAELIKLVSKTLRIPRTHLQLASGKKGRKKRLKIAGIDPQTLQDLIARSVPPA